MQTLALKSDSISYFELNYFGSGGLIKDYIHRAKLVQINKSNVDMDAEIPLYDSNFCSIGYIECFEKDKDQIKELLNNC